MITASAILSAVVATASAIFLTMLASWLQNRSWIRQNYTRNRNDARTDAVNTLSRLTEIVSKRVYRQKIYARSIISGDADRIPNAREDYQKSLIEWNDNFGSIKIGIRHYFGRYAALRFEDELMGQLVQNGRELESLDKRQISVGAASLERELSVIAYKFSVFTEHLLSNANRYNIADIVPEDEISYRNAANLTLSFLIFRLFRKP
ncbi:MAG: hypothetical protein J0I45_12240 [Bosea sp.]|nr:hypothetical protein [Bosea sp. (in: a-proteobacteria)]